MRTPAFKWEVVYDIVFVYSWAVAAGLIFGAVYGWAIGALVLVAATALIYLVERRARDRHLSDRPAP